MFLCMATDAVGKYKEKLLSGYFRRVGMEVWVGSDTLALYTLLYFLFKIMSMCSFYNTVIMIKTKWKKEQLQKVHKPQAPTQTIPL